MCKMLIYLLDQALILRISTWALSRDNLNLPQTRCHVSEIGHFEEPFVQQMSAHCILCIGIMSPAYDFERFCFVKQEYA